MLARIFAERKQTGELDSEAMEIAFRAALHQAGAEPAAGQRIIGSQALV